MSYGWRTVDGDVVELCDECGFDARRCTDDASELGAAFAALAALADSPDADRRPAEETWSATEYVAHSVDVTRQLLLMVTDESTVAPITDLASATEVCARVVPTFGPEERAREWPDLYPFTVTTEWVVRHLLHDLAHHVLDVRRGYARLALADHPEVYTVER